MLTTEAVVVPVKAETNQTAISNVFYCLKITTFFLFQTSYFANQTTPPPSPALTSCVITNNLHKPPACPCFPGNYIPLFLRSSHVLLMTSSRNVP